MDSDLTNVGTVQNTALANMKSVVITQSNYIPWRGYFDQIRFADSLVFFDDAQFTRRDWRNRNKIKTAHGLLWLTVPVEVKGKFSQSIKNTRVADKSWADKHLKSIQAAYGKAPYWKEVFPVLEEGYARASRFDFLSEVNFCLIQTINSFLNIKTPISRSSDYTLTEGKNERLASICQQLGATHYLSGPTAKNYLDPAVFAEHGITVQYFDYNDYPDYPQLHGEFEGAVSMVDLLFNVGSSATSFMKTHPLESSQSL